MSEGFHYRDMQTPERFGELGMSSHHIEGISGTIKSAPEDFIVEEIPAYEPQGGGEHLFLWIEKKLLSGEELRRALAAKLAIPEQAIGMAGLKDRLATTRQYVSVPRTVESKISEISDPNFKVHSAKAHVNKLGTGHLRGNRFAIVIRGVDAEELQRARQIAAHIATRGVLNFFGPQRFGSKGDTADIGQKIIKGETAALSRHWRGKMQKRLALSAWQARLFNRYLGERLARWGAHNVIAGEAMLKLTGGMFRVEDPSREQSRVDAREIVTAGPIFGGKMFPIVGEAAAFERTVLESSGVTEADLKEFGKMMPGSRRANVVYPENLTIDAADDALTLSFTLPSGSYATVVTAEFLKRRLS